jgi:hypothetical protein
VEPVYEVALHRLSAPLRQFLVVLLGAARIGVAVEHHDGALERALPSAFASSANCGFARSLIADIDGRPRLEDRDDALARRERTGAMAQALDERTVRLTRLFGRAQISGFRCRSQRVDDLPRGDLSGERGPTRP